MSIRVNIEISAEKAQDLSPMEMAVLRALSGGTPTLQLKDVKAAKPEPAKPEPAAEPEPETEPEAKPKLKPQPRPLPGAAMQPPPPDPAAG